MKAFPAVLVAFVNILFAQQNLTPIEKMEASGDTAGTRAALIRAVEQNPSDTAALTNYAEFLEEYGDPGSRQAYGRLLGILRQGNDPSRTAEIAKRLAILNLLAGDRNAATQDLGTYRDVTGKAARIGTAAKAQAWPTTTLPGPLRSFARMAALPPDTPSDEILPELARNVVTNGYQASRSSEELEQTEFLKLVHRYLSQAMELDQMAGKAKVIEVPKCESEQAGELLRILGFRMRGGCGSDVVLETVNAARAFITTDSGFPVNQLEEALRTDRPFRYDYRPTPVQVLFGPEYWTRATPGGKDQPDFITAFISDPGLCRLYLGFSRLDAETAEALRKAAPFNRLRAYAHVLDFFGGMFEIQGGKAVVPGGQRSAATWAELVGASPEQGGAFFLKLLAKDDGWLASLYDALARINGPVQEYLVDAGRLKRFYGAVRGRITSPGPARPVFRSNTDMMLLTTRLHLDANGRPHIPGGVGVWKALFATSAWAKYDARISKAANGWKEPEDVLEALFALSRKNAGNEPLKIFMALGDLDQGRAAPLEPATVDRLARSFREFGSQYPVFAESRSLSNPSINQFLDTAEAIDRIRDPEFRSDVAGTFQALVSLWQILVRQQTIADAQADHVFSGLVGQFPRVRNDRELFDAGREGVKLLLAATPGGDTAPLAEAQERLTGLLAGAPNAAPGQARDQVVRDLTRILEAQRMIPLDTLFQLAQQFEGAGRGQKWNALLVNKLAGQISEIQLPRATLSQTERNTISFGYWTEKHIDAQRKLNLRAAIDKAGGNAEKLNELRGSLAPLLRDTLVGFNYAYYAPPGSEILYTNPLFVRSHDFQGLQGTNHMWRATEVMAAGWPSNGGGRLFGSLATLPYALADAEQNFLVPAQRQALIWGDLVPQMIISAKIPRWWNATPSQVHWVGLHLLYGRELLAESSFDPELRAQVVEELGRLSAPARTHEVKSLLEQGEVKEAVDRVTPSELFLLARAMASQRRDEKSCLAAEIKRLPEKEPREINYASISREFGTPKPTLANSYAPELMNLRTFPALMGYSSRLMAESWESNTLYWASLADEISLPPAELNVRIPEWTEALVEHIFASHLEDWPAVLKSLRLVGDDVRARSQAAGRTEKAALEAVSNR